MVVQISSRILHINSEWREPVLKKRILIIYPTIEQNINHISVATAEDVELAVAVAHRAFSRNKGKYWASASGTICAKYLRAIVSKIIERKSELAKLEAVDGGKPLDEVTWDIDDVTGCFEYYTYLVESLDAKQNVAISLPIETFKSYVLKEPLGVVGLITLWNYPLLMAAWKVALALATGCAGILKPFELVSITCLELTDVCREVGYPLGVLNILTGSGLEATIPLASHPNVDKIAFTKSTATWSMIMEVAAQMVKPVSLELDRKSLIILFEDVDLEKAAEWTVFGCFCTNGQICSTTSRLIAHESIVKEFLDRLVKWTKNMKISDPVEEGCRLGPVVSA